MDARRRVALHTLDKDACVPLHDCATNGTMTKRHSPPFVTTRIPRCHHEYCGLRIGEFNAPLLPGMQRVRKTKRSASLAFARTSPTPLLRFATMSCLNTNLCLHMTNHSNPHFSARVNFSITDQLVSLNMRFAQKKESTRRTRTSGAWSVVWVKNSSV